MPPEPAQAPTIGSFVRAIWGKFRFSIPTGHRCYSTESAVYNYTDLAGTVCIDGTDRKDSWNAKYHWHNGITLADDAMIRGGRFYLGHNADRRTLELNGHTLTLNLPTGMVFERNLKAVGGRIAVTAGEIQPESGTDFTEVGVDFSGDAIVFLAYDLIVKDFSYSAARWGSHANATQVYVGGVYTAGANRPPVTLKDGATLDLSAQTGVWSADGQAATSGANDRYISGTGLVSFADGATIKVDLGERPLTSGLQLVKWTNKPTNVRFRPSAGANCGFVVNGNGLYVSKGLMIFIQ